MFVDNPGITQIAASMGNDALSQKPAVAYFLSPLSMFSSFVEFESVSGVRVPGFTHDDTSVKEENSKFTFQVGPSSFNSYTLGRRLSPSNTNPTTKELLVVYFAIIRPLNVTL